MKIGILALQGAIQPHEEKLQTLGVTSVQVRRTEHLEGLDGLILPGGESSAMIHLAKLNQVWDPILRFVREKPTWGVCAGTILLAKRVTHPSQESLTAMDFDAVRNAYGRQTESFIAPLDFISNWKSGEPVEGVFIRAPKIENLGPGVEILLTHKGEPVMVREKHLLASTFHPELTGSSKIHQYFLEMCKI